MIEEPFFPFLVDKNIVEFFLQIVYKCNRLDEEYDYFAIIESLHEIGRALTNLSFQQLYLENKRIQNEFNLYNTIVHLNSFVFHVNTIIDKMGLEDRLNLVFDKQIKSVTILNENSNVSFKIVLYSAEKIILRLDELIEQLNLGMKYLKECLSILEKKWYKAVNHNKLSLIDYIRVVKIHLDLHGFETFSLFTHFIVMCSIRYYDAVNINALQKYQKTMQTYLNIAYVNPSKENYVKLSEIVDLKYPIHLEEDMKIAKYLININSNPYLIERANFIFRQNREFIFEHLYWEDDLSNYAKYGLFFLAVFYYSGKKK